ncbi:MAG: rhodanese [Sulfuritalea sp.]|nr:rhodanese [Sulfuritalea sp.]
MSLLQRISALLLPAFIAVFLPASQALANETPSSVPGVEIVNVAKAKELIAGGIKFYDVRVPADFADGHIKGAVSLPYTNASENKPDFDASKDVWAVNRLPANKSEPILIYGNSPKGWRHYKASVLAARAGHTKVYWLRDGIDAWKAAGNPVQ